MEKCTNKFCNICNKTIKQQTYFSRYQSPNIVIVPTMSFESGPPAKKPKFSIDKVEISQCVQEYQSNCNLSKTTTLNNCCVSIDSQNNMEPNHFQSIGHQEVDVNSHIGKPLPPTNMDIIHTSDIKSDGKIANRTIDCKIETSVETEGISCIDKQVKTLLSSILPPKPEEKCDKVTAIKAKSKPKTYINQSSKSKHKSFESTLSPSTRKNNTSNISRNEKPYTTLHRKIKNISVQKLNSKRKSPCLKCKPRHNSATEKKHKTTARNALKENLLAATTLKIHKYKQSNTIKTEHSSKMSKVSTNRQPNIFDNKPSTVTPMKSVVHITKKYDLKVSSKKKNKSVHNGEDLRDKVSKYKINADKRDNLIVTIPNSNKNTENPTETNSYIEQPDQKIKTIKLVINLICQRSKDSENKIIDSQQQPSDDLSFLDDFNVDDIVDCLNGNESKLEVTNMDKIDDNINTSLTDSKANVTLVKLEEYESFDEERSQCQVLKQSDICDNEKYDDIRKNNKEKEMPLIKKENDVNEKNNKEKEMPLIKKENDVNENSITMPPQSLNNLFMLENFSGNELLNSHEASRVRDDIVKKEINVCETERIIQNLNNNPSDYRFNIDMILTESNCTDVLIKLTGGNSSSKESKGLEKCNENSIESNSDARKVTETIINDGHKSFKKLNKNDSNFNLIKTIYEEKLPKTRSYKILSNNTEKTEQVTESNTSDNLTKFNKADDHYNIIEMNSDKKLQETHYKKMLVNSKGDYSEERKKASETVINAKDKNLQKLDKDVDNYLIKTTDYKKFTETRDKILVDSHSIGSKERVKITVPITRDEDTIPTKVDDAHNLIKTNNDKTLPDTSGDTISIYSHENDSEEREIEPITSDKVKILTIVIEDDDPHNLIEINNDKLLQPTEYSNNIMSVGRKKVKENIVTDEDKNIKKSNKDNEHQNLIECNTNKKLDTDSFEVSIELNGNGDKNLTPLINDDSKKLSITNSDGDKNLVESSKGSAMNLTDLTFRKLCELNTVGNKNTFIKSEVDAIANDDNIVQFNSDRNIKSTKSNINEDKPLIEPSQSNRKGINDTEVDLILHTQHVVPTDKDFKQRPEAGSSLLADQNKDIELNKYALACHEAVVENKNEYYSNTFYAQLKKDLKIRMYSYLHVKYEIDALIHNGKYSYVFKCKDTAGKEYAIKVLHKINDRLISGFQKEQMLMALQNEIPKEKLNFIFVINSFGFVGYWCFLMEYYPKNLKQVLKERRTSFHINDIQRLSRQLVSAVLILRNNNIVHSDIKPGHILMNGTLDRLKLCGFDEMRYHDDNFYVLPNIGTSSYRAPEIILGISASFSIDVWSTALVMYEMATCCPLFPGSFNNDILYKQIQTLGVIPQDMIHGSRYKNYHFCGKYFMRRFGPGTKDVTLISKFIKYNRLAMTVYETYNMQWAKSKTSREKKLDEEKIDLFIHLLKQMLAIHPHDRLPIEFVFADAFIFEMCT